LLLSGATHLNMVARNQYETHDLKSSHAHSGTFVHHDNGVEIHNVLHAATFKLSSLKSQNFKAVKTLGNHLLK
jgi:hypothetical protein